MRGEGGVRGRPPLWRSRPAAPLGSRCVEEPPRREPLTRRCCLGTEREREEEGGDEAGEA